MESPPATDPGEQFNVNDLRRIISTSLRKLESGETTPAVANATANLTGKMFTSYKLEMEYAKLLGKNPNIGPLLS